MPNGEKSGHILTIQKCEKEGLTPAPTHCRTCLTRIKTYATVPLSDGLTWRYRVCGEGCYRKRALMFEVPDGE